MWDSSLNANIVMVHISGWHDDMGALPHVLLMLLCIYIYKHIYHVCRLFIPFCYGLHLLETKVDMAYTIWYWFYTTFLSFSPNFHLFNLPFGSFYILPYIITLLSAWIVSLFRAFKAFLSFSFSVSSFCHDVKWFVWVLF